MFSKVQRGLNVIKNFLFSSTKKKKDEKDEVGIDLNNEV